MLDPQIKELLETSLAAPKHATFTVAGARAGTTHLSQLLGGPQEPIAAVVDQMITENAIPIRIYRPSSTQNTPTIVYFHGAGWVAGDLDSYDNICRALAVEAQAVVVSVSYRLAPEHPYPAAPDDGTDAVRWAAENIMHLGGDPHGLVVAGDSAGGNLATVVTRRLRREGIEIALQALFYPVLDATMRSASYTQLSEGYYISRTTMEAYWANYLGNSKIDRMNPDLSPLFASDLNIMPPTLVMVAEYDPLRDEGRGYAAHLSQAGVSVQLIQVPGAIHGFLRFRTLDVSRAAMSQVANAIRVMIAQKTNERLTSDVVTGADESPAKAAVISKIVAKPGYEKALQQASIDLSHTTADEAGCVSYHFHQSVNNPSEFVFYEEFLSQEDLQRHLDAPHTKVWFDQMKQIAVGSPDITRLTPIVSVRGQSY